jgi:hypothetical protein
MGPQDLVNLAPILQWGFAGFALILLGVLVWLINKLLDVLHRTAGVIGHNTRASRDLASVVQQVSQTTADVRDRLLTWKCPFGPAPPDLLRPLELFQPPEQAESGK